MPRTKLSYREKRERNNQASYRSKAQAIDRQKERAFVAFHPDLSPDERQAALAWLDGDYTRALTSTAKDVLRKHLSAARTSAYQYYRDMLKRLESTEENAAHES